MESVQVLILERDAAFAEELKNYFSAKEHYSVCGVTDSGEEGICLIKNLNPNAVILGLYSDDSDGFAVMEEAKKERRQMEFVVVGAADDKTINRAVSLGARYYLLKSAGVTGIGGYVTEIPEERRAPLREGV